MAQNDALKKNPQTNKIYNSSKKPYSQLKAPNSNELFNEDNLEFDIRLYIKHKKVLFQFSPLITPCAKKEKEMPKRQRTSDYILIFLGG